MTCYQCSEVLSLKNLQKVEDEIFQIFSALANYIKMHANFI